MNILGYASLPIHGEFLGEFLPTHGVFLGEISVGEIACTKAMHILYFKRCPQVGSSKAVPVYSPAKPCRRPSGECLMYVWTCSEAFTGLSPAREGKREEGEFTTTSNTCLFSSSFPDREKGEGAGLGEVILTFSPPHHVCKYPWKHQPQIVPAPHCTLPPCCPSQPGPSGSRGWKSWTLRTISAGQGSISLQTIFSVFNSLQDVCKNSCLL